MREKAPLPTPIPQRGDSAERLLAWVTNATSREHNPLVAVQRYGYELDARLVLRMENGEKVRVRQRELMGANGLRHVMLAYDGTEIPGYDQASCAKIVARIVWASEATVENDEIETLIDEVSAFLDVALGSEILAGRYDDLDGHRLVSDFATANRRTAAFAVLALNEAADPPELWVPRGRLVAFLRERNSKVHIPDLRSSLHELGWRWADPERRAPGGRGRKARARIWALPADWNECAFDLAEAVDNATVRPAPPRRERAA